MANAFAINITAADNASAIINKVTAAVEKFTKPIRNTQDVLSKIGKDTGLDKVAKSLSSAGTAANAMLDKLGSVSGAAGSLAGIGTVSGLAALTRQWADMGLQATNTAYRIGIGADQLARFQSAARLGGLSGETATQGASAMAKNIGDVLSGRNPQMAGYFAQLGIRAKYDANGQADVASAYRDLARALERAPTVQGKNAILNALGQPEDIRRLVENMDQLTNSAAQFRPNAGAAADAGSSLGKSLSKLGENMTGAAENAELILAPGLKKIVDWLGDLAERANKATQSLGPLAHLGVILSGAAGGAAAGAATGAGIGALFGGIGAGPGALGGAIVGGVTGAATAASVDLLGASGIKRNNPGNLRVPGQNAFQTYASPEDGLNAAARNLIAYERKHGINTVSGIVGRWAPANENDTEAYIRKVSERTGILPNAPIDGSEETNASILSAIVKQEQGKQPFTPEQYAQAIKAAMAEGGSGGQGQNARVDVHVTTPAGSSVSANSSSPFAPVRVHYSMPTGAVNP